MADTSTLIDRWRDGDERAAEALYNQHRDATYRLAYGLLDNARDAEEVTQDALAYALRNIQNFDATRASFKTWLHTITISRCRDRLRRKRLPSFSLNALLGRGEDIRSAQPDLDQHASRNEARSQVWQAIQSLNPALREAILLRYWAGHTFREMAEILNCPLPTAQSRVRLAYKHLRNLLSETDLADLEHEEAQ